MQVNCAGTGLGTKGVTSLVRVCLQDEQLEQVEALVADLAAKDVILADVHRLFSAGEDPGRSRLAQLGT